MSAPVESDWTPPVDPDLQEILHGAQIDSMEKRYTVALAKHLWFHQNALRIDGSMSGVRLSFALSYWYRLGQEYPPAMEKLKEARDVAKAEVLAGTKVFESFHDFSAINKTLGEDDETRRLFVWLDQQSENTAKKIFHVAMPALIKAEELQLCGKYLEPKRSYDLSKNLFRMDRASTRSEEHREMQIDFTKKRFANSVSILIGLLVVNNRFDEAKEIMVDAKKEWLDASFHSALDMALCGHVPQPWP